MEQHTHNDYTRARCLCFLGYYHNLSVSVFAAKQYECVCVYNVRKLGQVNRRDEVHKRLRDTKHKTQSVAVVVTFEGFRPIVIYATLCAQYIRGPA